METIFTEVSLEKVKFIDNSFDILISITDFANIEHNIFCKHVNVLKMQNTYELLDEEMFPTFVSDIFYEELEARQIKDKFKSLGYEFTEGFPYNPNNNLIIPQNQSYAICV